MNFWTNRFEEKNLISRCEKIPTPYYLYSKDSLIYRYNRLMDVIGLKTLQISYAVKANPLPEILKTLKDIGAGLDVVSPAEALLASECGFPEEKILFTGNSLTPEEITGSGNTNILFNIGSLSELELFGGRAPGSDVVLRINTGIGSGENEKIVTCGNTTKFGLDRNKVDQARDLADHYGLKIVGLHKHSGSGITDLPAYLESVSRLCSFADPKHFPDLRFLNFGGGLTVPYRPEAKETVTGEFGKRFRAVVVPALQNYPRQLDVVIEPGKYLTAECAVLIVRARLVKANGNRLIVGTDSGFTHLIRPVLYNAYHPVLNLSNPNGEPKIYDITGNICETGDRFAEQRSVPEIREGDLLAITHAGAYGRSMASVYNLRSLPAEWLLEDGQFRRLSRALSPEELVQRVLQGEL